MSARRMAILGGGPIGLESLLRACDEGWDARLYERERVAENVRHWGHVRMFSPVAMNVSERWVPYLTTGLEPCALVTGEEYVERCMEPLARSPLVAHRIFPGTEVVAVSRDGLRKGEEIATAGRGCRAFRLLLKAAEGERVEEADVVLDATGTFATHNWLGQGGIPALGERSAAGAIAYHLPDILGRERERFAGRHTLVVGAGHSAATAILWLGQLARDHPRTHVTWITRSASLQPIQEIEADALAERARVTAFANDAARGGAPWLRRAADSVVMEVRCTERGVAAAVAESGETQWIAADRLLALVGYRPDLDLTRELHVQTCWATEGTYPLAAALLSRDGAAAADCLRAGEGLGPATLLHPEPGFFTLGAKSYGRNSNFLIRTGFRQVEDVFTLLAARVG